MPESVGEVKDDEDTLSEKYIADTLARINNKNKKFQCDIVYLADIREIERYLEENPHKSKMGFLVKAPSYMNQPGHHTPIYFERNRENNEHFVQFDSAMAVPYILPESKDPLICRKLYYSPYQRQVEKFGCFEDAIKILTHCFQEHNLFEFCKKNSKLDEVITIPLTLKDQREYSRIYREYELEKEDKHRTLPKNEALFLRLYNAKKHMLMAYKRSIKIARP